MKDNHIGKVAKCKKGIIGVITGSKMEAMTNRTIWTGHAIGSKKTWQTVNPHILANSEDEYNLQMSILAEGEESTHIDPYDRTPEKEKGNE